MELDPAHLLAAEAAWIGLGFLSGSLALAVGALTGRRPFALAAGAAAAAYGYVFNALANQNADLAWLRNISPYSWAYRNAPLTEGFDVPGLLLLAAACAVFTATAVLALRRRDVLG